MDFRGGQRDERLLGVEGWRLLGISSRIGVDTETDEEGVGQQYQGDVAIPAEVTAHFIVIESEGFTSLQILLDMPAAPNGPHDDGQRRVRARPDQVGAELAGIVEEDRSEERRVGKECR